MGGKDIVDAPSFSRALDMGGDGGVSAHEIAKGLKRIDHFVTDGDIQALVETLDTDGNGQMDLGEIMRWIDYELVGASVAMQIREVFSEARTLFGHKVTDAGSLFDALDLDGSGCLDFDEIISGLRSLKLSVGFPEFDALFATMGKDRGSQVDKEELIWILDSKSQLERI